LAGLEGERKKELINFFGGGRQIIYGPSEIYNKRTGPEKKQREIFGFSPTHRNAMDTECGDSLG